jgi:hypothetical protein
MALNHFFGPLGRSGYKGMSNAIHVHGPRVELPTPGPVYPVYPGTSSIQYTADNAPISWAYSHYEVDGSRGYAGLLAYPGSGTGTWYRAGQALNISSLAYPVDMTCKVEVLPTTDPNVRLDFDFGTNAMPNYPYPWEGAMWGFGPNLFLNPAAGTVQSDSTVFSGFFDFSLPNMLRIYASPTLVKFKLWRPSDPEPEVWMGVYVRTPYTYDTANSCGFHAVVTQLRQYGYTYDAVGFWIDDLIVSNLCGLNPIDTFTRTVSAGGWGTSGWDTSEACIQSPIPIVGIGGGPGVPLGSRPIGYLPAFRYQIGDPTTVLDSYICGLESAAMALDWQTRGAVQVWGGELVPWCGRSTAEIQGLSGPDEGTTLNNLAQAWSHWNQYLEIRTGESWNDLVACLNQGRVVILDGLYSAFSAEEKAQAGYNGGHAIIVLPYTDGTNWTVGDPLRHEFVGLKSTSLQAYAEVMGAAAIGSSSPQRILFAVTRPWAN